MDRQEVPINWQARKGTETAGSGVASVDASDLQKLTDFLGDKFGYNPGSYETSNVPTKADRITARVDWNINKNNILSVKYFYLKSFNTNMPSTSGATGGSRAPGEGRIPFSSSFYRTNNNFNIIMADLSTTINSKMSNTLKIGYSRLRDYREMDGGTFPQVDILDGAGWKYRNGTKAGGLASTDYKAGASIMTTFGTEENSYNNMLNSDIYQIQDNFTINAGNHQLTIGTQSDYRSFKNGYARSFAGVWEYNSLDAFYKDVNEYNAWVAGGKPTGGFKSLTTKYNKAYSLQEEFPYAKVDVLTLGFYIQDKWTITPRLNVTIGLRLDTPIYMTDLDRNENLEAEVFQNGETIDVSKYPKTTPMFSPRLGFNWDVLGDRTLQVRGGTGIFAGTPPYVWISNQAGNNGLLFGSLGMPYDTVDPATPADKTKYPNALTDIGFDGDVNYGPAKGTTPSADIAAVDRNFKYPQLWKTNIAIDAQLGNGWSATAELLYNKDINGIYHSNIALPDANGSDAFQMVGPDNRTIYTKNSTSKIAKTAVVMKNTSKGYSIYTTLKLQKDVLYGALRGLSVNGAYTFGRSRSVTDGSSSVAKSAWQYRPALNPNGEELGFSAGGFKDRLLITASYRKEYAKNYATSVGLIFDRYSPFRFSYTYYGDLNGDGINSNDLIFVPASKDQITLVPANQYDKRTADEQWIQLDNFISQDKYLSTRRGKYTERNGGIAPYVNQLDLNVTQDFFVTTKSGKRNTIRITLDIMNVGNLLCKNWGIQQTTVLGYQQYQFLNMIDKPSKDKAATFAFPYVPNKSVNLSQQTVLTDTFKDYITQASRWRMQIGIKYMFN